MKIDPALPSPAGPPIPLPTGAEPSQPFADFLSGGALPGRALAFAELGMFGCERQAPGPAGTPPSGNPPAESDKAVMPIESLDEAIGRPAADVPAVDTQKVEPGQRPTGIVATSAARPGAPIALVATADAGFASPPAEPASADEDAASVPGAIRLTNRAPPQRSDVSLIVTEKDGGVGLVAAGPPIPLPTGAEPSQPFADFLSGGALPGRAFAFAELGMFGCERQTPDPVGAPPSGNLPAGSDKAVMPIESLDEAVARPAADSPAADAPAVDTQTVEPGQCPTRVVAISEARPGAPIALVATADAGFANPSAEPASADEDGASVPGAMRRTNRAPQQRSDVSLIVTEKNGGVELVAAGPALDPETGAHLRRLVRAILARSGLDLAQFYLNGVPLAPDSTIMIGGSHGTRTR